VIVQYSFLALFAILLASGQLLFKQAALVSLERPLPGGFFTLWMLSALCLYGVATLLWVWLLRTIPLSTAYPFSALGFVLVPLLAKMIFHENLTANFSVGAVLIVAGILVITR
jgi:drug/metabolite transporter (DMT)-like permease